MIVLPDLGSFQEHRDVLVRSSTSDGRFVCGHDGVRAVVTTRDAKVEFVAFERHTMAAVRSSLGQPAYYPVPAVSLEKPIGALLMDLDGTTVRSEHFWVWIIERAIGSLIGHPTFALQEEDAPFVAGHSVSEHLQYCIDKYCPGRSLEQARGLYFEHTKREMHEVLEGRGRVDAFVPTPGLKGFLLRLKASGVRIALVTSGLYEKAWPEIVAAFRQLDLGNPAEFYDAIITGGFPLRRGEVGTLGELSPKPHPWLYAEAARVGLGLTAGDRARVVGLEDSGAGVLAIRLAGFAAVGLSGGNILESGTAPFCQVVRTSLDEVLDVIL